MRCGKRGPRHPPLPRRDRSIDYSSIFHLTSRQGRPSHMRYGERFQPVSLAFDRTTFDRLVLEHLASAQRFAIRMTGDADAAEDLMQEALLRAHRAWQTFRGESKFTTWLFRIVINCFRDRIAASPRSTGNLTDDVTDVKARDPARDAQSREFGEIIA